MTQNLLVMDVANVYLRDLETKKIIGTTTASANAINSTLEQDVLRAGWGGGVVASISSSKTVELSFEDVFFSLEYLSLQQGTTVEANKTGKVLQHFIGKVKNDGTDDYIEVPADVTATTGYVTDKDGEQLTVAITPAVSPSTVGEASLPTGHDFAVDEEVTVYYEKTITGKRVSIDSAKFPKYVEVLMHTRAFDPETNVVSQDIYAKMHKCQVGGESSIELGVNTPLPTSMSFTAMNKSASDTELGEFWQVDRV